MKLAIDLDGVVLDSIASWLKKYHPNYTNNDIKSWNAWELVKTCNSKEQFFDEFGRQDPKQVKLIDGAKETILRLEREHEIYFLTSKSERGQKWSEKVLKREGLGHIPVINSWLEKKSKNEYNFDILLDDSPLHSEFAVVFDQPWNKDIHADVRVHSWKEFEEYVKQKI